MLASTQMKGRKSALGFGNFAGMLFRGSQLQSPGRRILLIDNYDSFTFNLYQMLKGPLQCDVAVVRNDAVTWVELQDLSFDGVVLSPGPGNPTRQKDFGVCADVLKHCSQPILGVCLGHQGIGAHYGVRVRRASEPYHGQAQRD
jgi:anthranilate/para-aminobenzoate synthase component II